jgi:hypothetical protein
MFRKNLNNLRIKDLSKYTHIKNQKPLKKLTKLTSVKK